MRLFLAINLDADTRRAIVDAIGPLRAAAPSLRWTADPKLHLTLKFLGSHNDGDAVTRLRDAADAVAARHRRFVMRIHQVGAFPNFRRARVVWTGVAQDTRLELLHHDLEVACDARGFELDGRPFRPHVTLARVPEGTEKETLRQLSRLAKRVDLDEECDVDSIDLMKSTPGSPEAYERLHASPLGSR